MSDLPSNGSGHGDLNQKMILDLTENKAAEDGIHVTATSRQPRQPILQSEDDRILKGIVRNEVKDLLRRGTLQADHRSVATLTTGNDDLRQKVVRDLTENKATEDGIHATTTPHQPRQPILRSEGDKMLKGIVGNEVNELLRRGTLQAEHRSVATPLTTGNGAEDQEGSQRKYTYPAQVSIAGIMGQTEDIKTQQASMLPSLMLSTQDTSKQQDDCKLKIHSVVENYVLGEKQEDQMDQVASPQQGQFSMAPVSNKDLLSPPPTTSLARERRVVPVTQPGAVAITNTQFISGNEMDYEEEMNQGDSSTTDEELSPQHLLDATLVEDGPKDQQDEGELVEAEPALEGFAALADNPCLKPIVFSILLIVVLAVTIPLAILLPESGKKNLILDGIEPKLLQCGTRRIQQSDYRGLKTKTEIGRECQDWSSQYPHQHEYTPDAYPDANLLSNYCRNPSDDKPRAWCYTKDPNHRWAFCDVAFCDEDAYEFREECSTAVLGGDDYRGNISVSATGKTCLPWNRSGQYTTSENFPNAGLEANYCRNPESDQPYCMVNDPRNPKEMCDLPPCQMFLKNSKHKEPCKNCTSGECGTPRLHFADYRGTVNVTANGDPCLIWRDYLSMNEVDEDAKDTNYCRTVMVLGDTFPSCAYIHPTLGYDGYSNCDVPRCEDNFVPRRFCGSKSRAQDDYRGDVKVSLSGKECRPWTNEDAILESWNPNMRPWDGLLGSYCRNPMSDDSVGSLPQRAGPWCYIEAEENGKHWEYCDVPYCKDCGTSSLAKEDYTGTIANTRSGNACLPWEDREYLLIKENNTLDVVVEHQGTNVSYQFGIRAKYSLEENYCRNPLPYQRETVFCFIDEDGTWEYCDVPDCEEPGMITHTDCGSHAEGQADYRGDINITVSGKACRPWASQEEYTPELYPAAGLEDGYCRQPAGSARLAAWCFVNETKMTWEYCDVPIC